MLTCAMANLTHHWSLWSVVLLGETDEDINRKAKAIDARIHSVPGFLLGTASLNARLVPMFSLLLNSY